MLLQQQPESDALQSVHGVRRRFQVAFSERFAKCPVSLDWNADVGKYGYGRCPLVIGRFFNQYLAYAKLENAQYGLEPFRTEFAGANLAVYEENCKRAITRAMAILNEEYYAAENKPGKYQVVKREHNEAHEKLFHPDYVPSVYCYQTGLFLPADMFSVKVVGHFLKGYPKATPPNPAHKSVQGTAWWREAENYVDYAFRDYWCSCCGTEVGSIHNFPRNEQRGLYEHDDKEKWFGTRGTRCCFKCVGAPRADREADPRYRVFGQPEYERVKDAAREKLLEIKSAKDQIEGPPRLVLHVVGHRPECQVRQGVHSPGVPFCHPVLQWLA